MIGLGKRPGNARERSGFQVFLMRVDPSHGRVGEGIEELRGGVVDGGEGPGGVADVLGVAFKNNFDEAAFEGFPEIVVVEVAVAVVPAQRQRDLGNALEHNGERHGTVLLQQRQLPANQVLHVPTELLQASPLPRVPLRQLGYTIETRGHQRRLEGLVVRIVRLLHLRQGNNLRDRRAVEEEVFAAGREVAAFVVGGALFVVAVVLLFVAPLVAVAVAVAAAAVSASIASFAAAAVSAAAASAAAASASARTVGS